VFFNLPLDQQVAPSITDSTYVVGWLLNWGLYGALSAQVFLYYMAFPRDRFHSKALVYGVFLIETVQTVLLLHDGYIMYSARSTGVHENLLDDLPRFYSERAAPFAGGVVSFIVQIFYAHRLSVLADSTHIFIFIVPTSLVQFAALISTNFDFNLPWIVVMVFWATASVACDVVIAITMTYHLLRRDTQWRDTHRILVGLVRLSLETGIITTISVIVFVLINIMVTSDIRPLRYISTPFVLLFDKLYANMMMLTLNHRMTAFNPRINNPTSELAFGDSLISGPAPTTSRHTDKSDVESRLSKWGAAPTSGFAIPLDKTPSKSHRDILRAAGLDD